MFAMSISLPCGTGHRVPPAPEEAVGVLSPASLLTPSQYCVCHRLGQKNPTSAPQGASWGDGASSLMPLPAAPAALESRACAQSRPTALPAAPLRPPGAPGLEGTTTVPFSCLPPLLPAALLKVDFELFI